MFISNYLDRFFYVLSVKIQEYWNNNDSEFNQINSKLKENFDKIGAPTGTGSQSYVVKLSYVAAVTTFLFGSPFNWASGAQSAASVLSQTAEIKTNSVDDVFDNNSMNELKYNLGKTMEVSSSPEEFIEESIDFFSEGFSYDVGEATVFDKSGIVNSEETMKKLEQIYQRSTNATEILTENAFLSFYKGQKKPDILKKQFNLVFGGSVKKTFDFIDFIVNPAAQILSIDELTKTIYEEVNQRRVEEKRVIRWF